MNKLARVSCEACAALAGYREDCPDHDGVQNAIRAMITPYLLRIMADTNVDQVRVQTGVIHNNKPFNLPHSHMLLIFSSEFNLV